MRTGYVYGVLFSDGLVKVGRMSERSSRLSSYGVAASLRGSSVAKTVTSGFVVDSVREENKLIQWCREHGNQAAGREWFDGINFELLEAFILTDVKPSSDSEIKHAVDEAAKQVDRVAAALFPSRQEVGRDDYTEWAAALVHAKTLEQMFMNECYGGDLFVDIAGRGYSLFFLNAAIAFSQLSPSGAAELYASALEDSETCIGTIENLAAEAVAAFREAA